MGVWEGMSPGGGAGCLGTSSTGTFPLSGGRVAARPRACSPGTWWPRGQFLPPGSCRLRWAAASRWGPAGVLARVETERRQTPAALHFTACRGPLVSSLLVRPVGVVAGDGCLCSLLLSRPQGGRHVGEAGLQGSAVWPSVVGLCVHAHGSHRPSVRTPLCVMICQSLGAAAGFCTGQYTESVLCHHVACCFCKYGTQNVVL